MAGSDQDGYATPAAAIIAMAVAVVTIAYVTTTSSQAKLVRAEWTRSQSEFRLAGAHNVAVLTIVASPRTPPYRWTLSTLSLDFQVVAEPEYSKLGLASASTLADEDLARLGVGETAAGAVRTKLARLQSGADLAWPADASSAVGWRACAASIISAYGAAQTLPALAYVEPSAGSNESRWRAGEVWRVSVTAADGWRDERIIRFTGNGAAPAVVIGRRLTRGWKDPLACETLLAGA